MRRKVREVVPPADARGLEELIVEELIVAPEARREDGTLGGRQREPEPADIHVAEHRRSLTAADLGPNGEAVMTLLARASSITDDERHRLNEEAGWRWWPVTPLPGSGVTGARAAALATGRTGGRAAAMAALDSAVRELARQHHAAWSRSSSLPAVVANAGLAVLVRDLIGSETFETLFGPWREVMHH